MRTSKEVLEYLKYEMDVYIADQLTHARAIDSLLSKLMPSEEVVMPIKVSAVKNTEIGVNSRTAYVLLTNKHRLIYSTMYDPVILKKTDRTKTISDNAVFTRMQLGELILEVQTGHAKTIGEKLNTYLDNWEAKVGEWDRTIDQMKTVQEMDRKQRQLEEEEYKRKIEEEWRAEAKKREDLEKEHAAFFAVQKAERMRRRVEYKVLSQDDAWLSAHVNTNKLEYALNRYAAEGWRVVGCVSGDIYGILVGQKNQTVIILEREV